MKLKIKNKALQDAFAIAAQAARSGSPRPILEYVLLWAKADGTLTFCGQNGEEFVEVQLSNVEVSEGDMTLVHKGRFGSAIGAIRSREDLTLVGLEYGEGVEIRYGNDEMFSVPSLEGHEDFPSPKDKEVDRELVLDLAAVASILQSVVNAAASRADAGRFCMDHVQLRVTTGGKLRAIATNGKRIVTTETKHELDLAEDLEVCLPTCAVRFLTALWNDTPRKVRLRVGGWTEFIVEDGDLRCRQLLFSPPITAFPPVEEYLEDRDWDHEVRVGREKLLAAVQRVLAVQPGDQIGFIFRGVYEQTELRIAGIGSDGSKAATKIMIDTPWEGESYEIAFSPRFITSSLTEIPDSTVWWRFLSDNGRQCLMEGTRTRILIMPIHSSVWRELHDALEHARTAKLEKTHA